jgi:ABC-2 type transport system permease protein
MKTPRFLKVARRVLQGLRNDRRTLALIFVAPIFAMFVFGLAFSGEVKHVKVIVVNHDQGASISLTGQPILLSQEIIGNIDTDTVKVEYRDDEDQAVAAVKNGEAYGVIVFPENFTAEAMKASQDTSSSGGATVALKLDKSNVNVANAISKAISDAMLVTTQQMGRKLPLSVDASEAIYGQGARFIDFFVPGVMAFVVFVLTTLLTLVSFVSEKTTGTLDRVLATPVSESDVVLGYATAFGTIGVIQSALLLVIAIVAFGIIIEGNVFLAFVVIALLAVVSQALGILMSSLARREAQAVQLFPFIMLPAFLLAGVFWPLEAIPGWLRPLSYLVPPTYAADACRSVMLRGWGIGKIWIDILALLAFAAAFLFLATLLLKRRKA